MRFAFTLLLIPALSILMAQNSPTVTITNVLLDEGAGTVTIFYDLAHDETSGLLVELRASLDEGMTFIAGPLTVSGDAGAGITPGPGRSMIWTYDGINNINAATVQVIARNDQVPDIQQMVDQVDQQVLADLLEQVAIPRHHSAAPQGLQAVRDLIHSQFQQHGLRTGTHTATYLGTSASNILGRQPGLTDPGRTYIVDGHYDAVVNTPGADDNATAVVAMLEISRILSQYNFKNSLRYIGFAFEEQGFIGSMQYVQNGIAAWEQIHGVLNMEMIGYYSDEPQSQTMPAGFQLLFPAAATELADNEFRGDFLTVVGNTVSDPLTNVFVTALDQYVPQLKRIALSVPGNGEMAPDLRRSDHAPFWDAGIRALMLTDGSNYRNPHYHLPSDVVATINMEFFTNCTKAVLAAAATLAEPVNAGHDSFALNTIAGIHDHHGFPCKAVVRPNPARDHIHLELNGCAGERLVVELFDLRGNKIMGTTLTATDGEHQLPVQGVAPGIYLLLLQAGENTTTIKVELEQ